MMKSENKQKKNQLYYIKSTKSTKLFCVALIGQLTLTENGKTEEENEGDVGTKKH